VNQGHFIVIEGIDGSGTTTQCAILAERLLANGQPAHTTREPSDGPIGVLIRQILTGRVVVPGGWWSPAATAQAHLVGPRWPRCSHPTASIIWKRT